MQICSLFTLFLRFYLLFILCYLTRNKVKDFFINISPQSHVCCLCCCTEIKTLKWHLVLLSGITRRDFFLAECCEISFSPLVLFLRQDYRAALSDSLLYNQQVTVTQRRCIRNKLFPADFGSSYPVFLLIFGFYIFFFFCSSLISCLLLIFPFLDWALVTLLQTKLNYR